VPHSVTGPQNVT